MIDKSDKYALMALKIALSYTPKTIGVTKYRYNDGDRYQFKLSHIKAVQKVLLINDINSDVDYAETDPDNTLNTSY